MTLHLKVYNCATYMTAKVQ